MLPNANQEYQPVIKFLKQIINQKCKQVRHSKIIQYTIKRYQVYWQEISNVTSIKYASKEISNMLWGNLLKLLSKIFKYTSKRYQVCYQNNIKLVMDVLQRIGTYSGCHNAWSIRPTCQSLGCDIMAVGTYWYHSDWLWPLTNRCTNAVFRPSALTGTARSLANRRVS